MIKFEPSIEEFESTLLNMFDYMYNVIQSIPKIETRLYSDWVSVACIMKTTEYHLYQKQ